MSTTATVPSTVHIRPSRLAGLLVAVAIVTRRRHLVRQPGHNRGPHQHHPKSEVISTPGAAAKAYFNGVVAAPTPSSGRRASETCTRNQSQQRLDTEAKLGINLDDFDKAEQDFLISLAAGGELVTTLSR